MLPKWEENLDITLLCSCTISYFLIQKFSWYALPLTNISIKAVKYIIIYYATTQFKKHVFCKEVIRTF